MNMGSFPLYSVHGWKGWLTGDCAHKERNHFLYKRFQNGNVCLRHQTPEVADTCSEFNLENVICLQFKLMQNSENPPLLFVHGVVVRTFPYKKSFLLRASPKHTAEQHQWHLCFRPLQCWNMAPRRSANNCSRMSFQVSSIRLVIVESDNFSSFKNRVLVFKVCEQYICWGQKNSLFTIFESKNVFLLLLTPKSHYLKRSHCWTVCNRGCSVNKIFASHKVNVVDVNVCMFVV